MTVSIEWSDRLKAAAWANWIVSEADAALRERGQSELARSIEFLQSEAAKTTVIEVRQTIYRVMETQLKNSMLARTREAYAFRVIDPAVVPDPDDRVSPKRSLVAAVGLGAGFFAGVLFAIVMQLRRSPRSA